MQSQNSRPPTKEGTSLFPIIDNPGCCGPGLHYIEARRRQRRENQRRSPTTSFKGLCDSHIGPVGSPRNLTQDLGFPIYDSRRKQATQGPRHRLQEAKDAVVFNIHSVCQNIAQDTSDMGLSFQWRRTKGPSSTRDRTSISSTIDSSSSSTQYSRLKESRDHYDEDEIIEIGTARVAQVIKAGTVRLIEIRELKARKEAGDKNNS
ncbi:hypothetical protein MKZ38_003071 [Zalerion maritima]|uniref:Uncharacterized protein n=1 Tax=Zalerion maritima TaxID=339359 RepID=A0AAD5RPG2_9PEZI|nr:hypothetical protein MKZ38_003071 [Zalerion maritima]